MGADLQLPVLYWLSGLTCTDENFVQKAGFQRLASELGLIVVAPDTSPRGEASRLIKALNVTRFVLIDVTPNSYHCIQK